jgi:hypothetical protein
MTGIHWKANHSVIQTFRKSGLEAGYLGILKAGNPELRNPGFQTPEFRIPGFPDSQIPNPSY